MIKRLLVIGLVMATTFATANTRIAEQSRFQSIMLYTFAKYIEWPEAQRDGNFTIGVLGNTEVLDYLEKMAVNKSKGGQKIKIKRFKSAKNIEACHILFISADKSDQLQSARLVMALKSALIVSEAADMCKKGSDLNFVISEGKLRFEMNSNLTSKAGVQVSSELSKFAILI